MSCFAVDCVLVDPLLQDAVCRNLSLVAPHATSLRAALPAWVEALGKEEAIEAVVSADSQDHKKKLFRSVERATSI